MSSKNKRKLLRKITVDNIQYYWFVGDNNCDGDGNSRFKIWKDKIKIFEELTYTQITPTIVRDKILFLNDKNNYSNII